MCPSVIPTPTHKHQQALCRRHATLFVAPLAQPTDVCFLRCLDPDFTVTSTYIHKHANVCLQSTCTLSSRGSGSANALYSSHYLLSFYETLLCYNSIQDA
jgi:hypothetical protein